MADYKVDISKLPEEVREKLAELDLELSEGEQKHYGISGEMVYEVLNISILA